MSDTIELIVSQIKVKEEPKGGIGGVYSLKLSEKGNIKNGFSVIIGTSEIQSIALRINNRRPIRPLTHDLIISILHELNATLQKVLIYKLFHNHFYAYLYLLLNNGKELVIDARTSDAVALAVKIDVPIFIKTEIFDKVSRYEEDFIPGIKIQKQEKNIHTTNLDIKKTSSRKIEKQLEKAIEMEDYELAAILRDELIRRQRK